MNSPSADSLLTAFARLTDPRHRRGVRHPFPNLLALTLLCQRPLAAAIVGAGRDYVLAVKDNQPDLHETIRTAFRTVAAPAAMTRENNAAAW